MFARSWAAAGFGSVFTLLLVLAVGWDLRHRRIPNVLVIATISLGIAFALTTLGVVRGAVVAAEGVAVGLALWLPWWWFGIMGAGDVKFFAAAAAWLGPRGALGAAVITALFGGILGVCWLVARALAGRRAAPGVAAPASHDEGGESVTGGPERASLPYGVAMAIGLGVAAWAPLFR